jgi:hypothetical protein
VSDARPTGGRPGRPRPVPGPSEVPQYSYGWLVYILGALLALAMTFLIFKLNYTYAQAPHRIIKILVGLSVLLVMLFRPRMALYAWLLAIPIGEWLPSTGIPGLNGPNMLIFAMMLGWVVPRIVRGERLMTRTRLTKPVAAYILLLFFALGRGWIAPPGLGYNGLQLLKSVWQVALGFAVYFAAANMVEDRKHVNGLLVTFAVGSSVGVLIALRQFLAAGEMERMGGALGDINDLGAYFAMTASALFGLFLTSGVFSAVRRWAVGASALLAGFGVMMPRSRGGYVAAVGGLGAVAYLVDKRAVVVFAIILALSPVWAPGFVKERVAETTVDTFEAELIGDATDRLDPSASVRLEIWKIVGRAFLRSPLVGYGYAAVPYLTAGQLSRPFSAHSLYFGVMGEAGIIGLAVLAWLLVSCLRSGTELLRTASTRQSRGLAVAFLGATVAVLVANIFGERLTHLSIAGSYFVLAGLVDRSIGLERESRAAGAAQEVD